jgi:hypothetical protein
VPTADEDPGDAQQSLTMASVIGRARCARPARSARSPMILMAPGAPRESEAMVRMASGLNTSVTAPAASR